MNACTNPEILRVIYFFLIILDIVKIIIPIALIILGLVDFSKATIISDEKVQKKTLSLFLKRILYAVLVFAVPWIVEVLMITLGNALGEEGKVNFTDCLENANKDKIAELDKNIELLEEKKCNGTAFLIKYYDDNGNEVENSAAECTDKEFYFQQASKWGYTFKGWDFKNNSTGSSVFTTGKKYIITEEFLDSVVSTYGGFDLIPIWEKITADNCDGTSFTVNYYDKNGRLIIDSEEFCTGQEILLKNIKEDGYRLKGWDFKNNSTGNVVFNADKKYIITKEFLDDITKKYNGFDLIPVWE